MPPVESFGNESCAVQPTPFSPPAGVAAPRPARAGGRRHAVAALAVVVLAVAVRWGYILQFPPGAQTESVDAQGYQALAVNLLDGHGFSLNSQAPYVPDAIRTPLYPVFVAAVYGLSGRDPARVAVIQAWLDALTALVVADVVRRLTGQGRWGWLAGGLYALNPILWRFGNELLTEPVLAAVTAWLLWAFVRYGFERQLRWLILAGVLAGLALLAKPNVVLLPAIVAAAVAMLPAGGEGQLRRGGALRERAARAVLIVGLALAVVFPWVLRNRLVFGRWFLSHAFENNLARVSAVATLARAQGEQVAPWTPRWEAIYSGLLLRAQARYGAAFQPVPATAREADMGQRQLAAIAVEIIREHPYDFVVSHLSGFLRSWVPQEHRFWYERLSGQTWDSLGSEEGVLGQAVERWRADGAGPALAFVWQARVAGLPPLALALWLGWLLAYALGAALALRGAWRLRRRPALLLLAWGTVLYTTFLPGPIAHVRFVVPVVPVLSVLMVAGLAPTTPTAASARDKE